MGMMLSGGIGSELAAWVLHGAPTLDLFGFDPARFHASTVADARWVQDRTHESYAKTYAIVFPSDEPLAGRGARRSALHDCLAAAGCVFQARHGFERPGWFVGPDVGAGALPQGYDYYGAYADEESGWRLGAGRADVAAHESHPYLDFVEGELTFGWPASFGRVAEEARDTARDAPPHPSSFSPHHHALLWRHSPLHAPASRRPRHCARHSRRDARDSSGRCARRGPASRSSTSPTSGSC